MKQRMFVIEIEIECVYFRVINHYFQELDVRALHHRRDINKKTRSGDKKMQKKLNIAKKVG